MDLISRLNRSLRGSLMISGTMIGAGMLGLPLLTASCGIFVATVLCVVVWAFMLVTGLLLLEASLTMDNHVGFISLARRYLGRTGALFTGGLFIFLYFFLLVAYLAAGAPLLKFFSLGVVHIGISDTSALVLFSLIFGLIVALGPKYIDNANVILTAGMAVVLLLLFSVGFSEVSIARMQTLSWKEGIFAIPLLFSAFGYHNLIPSLVTYMNRDKRALKDAIIIGTTIPLIIYILWQMLVIGAIPLSTLKVGALEGVTATTLFAQYAHKPWIAIIGQMFSFLAITTSVLGVSFALVDFIADGLRIKPVGKNRMWLTFLAFSVPLLLTMIDRTIFIRALSIAGGIGESLLNGMIPVALVYSLRYVKKIKSPYRVPSKKTGLALLAIFALFVFGVEAWHLLGL